MSSDRLPQLVARFLPGVERGLRCGPGWDGLLCRLDAELAQLFPGYGLYQVKEKYGTLRFYSDAAEQEPACCVAFQAEHPLVCTPTPSQEEAWVEAWVGHDVSDEHAVQEAAVELLRDRALMLIAAAEVESASVCEVCGAPGELLVAGGWYQTRCDRHRRAAAL